MADNIRNFSDYRKTDRRKKEKREEIEFATEEINSIEIQDPLDFLSAEEREEYYRAQHLAMDKERESLKEDEPEFYFDDEDDEPIKREPARREPEKRQERVQKQERPEKKRPAPEKDKKRAPEPKKEKQRAIRKRVREEVYEDYDDEDSEGGIDPLLIVRISSIVTGIIILALIGLIFKTKVYDRYLKPDPDKVETEVKVGELAGYTTTNDKVVTTAELNLRNTPSTASDTFIVVQVPAGTVLDRIAVSDDGEWAQVKYEDQLLFCVMKYVSVQE